jgi:[acyl-carrier-protein] S-malonyltransferase
LLASGLDGCNVVSFNPTLFLTGHRSTSFIVTIVYMFPGQNSRCPDMIDRLRFWNGCGRILENASDVLGRDLAVHYSADNLQMFSHNRDVQVGVFLAGYILSEWLATEGIGADASLGLSLGEYNHLVDIGALSFASALRLLDARGRAYENGPRGMMMSVFPCDHEQVRQALGTAADLSIELSTKHFVIGGETAAVQAAAARLEEEEFAEARVIDAALPMHSRLFLPAANAFREALEKTEWAPARKPYLPNVDGEFLIDARPGDFVDRLYRHVFNTVQWARSVAAIVNRYPDAALVEVGPGRVLYNAVSREYKHVRCFPADDPELIRKLKEASLGV